MRNARCGGLAVAACASLLAACTAAPPPLPTPASTPQQRPAAPPAKPSIPAPSGPLLIKGALTYFARIALPPQAVSLVELRDGASGALLGLERRRLDGRQVPLPFELVVERARLASGGPFNFRGGIVIDERAAWLTPTITLTGDTTRVDLGALTMKPLAAPPATAD